MSDPNDVIRLAIEQASQDFRGEAGLFNAAGFSNVIMRIAGLDGIVDGRLVRALLTGRSDVMPEPDGSHYRLQK